MKSFIKNIGKYLVAILKILIRKKDKILISCHDYQDYSGNSRFLYEYLSKYSDMDIYWFTNNSKVKRYLKSKSFKYISHKNIFKAIKIMLETKIVINSGDAYVDIFSIFEESSVYKISLTHGFGPKTDFLKLDQNLIKRIHKFDYVNFPSKYSIENNATKLYRLSRSKIISYGYPKNDSLFKKNESEMLHKDKFIIKNLFPDMDITNSTVILYTPTWRNYKSDIPFFCMPDYSHKIFSDLLDDKDILFICSPHPINRPNKPFFDQFKTKSNEKTISNNKTMHESFNHNRFVTSYNDQTLIDVNNLMHEADILLNDYSTTSIDYCITGKPQVFCLPDHEIYKKHVVLNKNYIEMLPGNWCEDFETFQKIIDEIIMNKDKYIQKYDNNIKRYLSMYYDVKNQNSSEKIKLFLLGLLKNK